VLCSPDRGRCPSVPPRLANGHILPISEGGFCALAQFVRKNTKKAPEAHSPTPIGQGHRRGDAHIVGYYAPRKQACLTGGLGHRDGAKRKARALTSILAQQLPWATPADNHGSRRRAGALSRGYWGSSDPMLEAGATSTRSLATHQGRGVVPAPPGVVILAHYPRSRATRRGREAEAAPTGKQGR
jgi:hypothetical protein